MNTYIKKIINTEKLIQIISTVKMNISKLIKFHKRIEKNNYKILKKNKVTI